MIITKYNNSKKVVTGETAPRFNDNKRIPSRQLPKPTRSSKKVFTKESIPCKKKIVPRSSNPTKKKRRCGCGGR